MFHVKIEIPSFPGNTDGSGRAELEPLNLVTYNPLGEALAGRVPTASTPRTAPASALPPATPPAQAPGAFASEALLRTHLGKCVPVDGPPRQNWAGCKGEEELSE